MDRSRLQKGREPLELLSRIVNKTSLSVKRVTHYDISDLGGRLQVELEKDFVASTNEAVQRAVTAAEQRAARELQAALRRQKEALDEAARVAALAAKSYYEKLAERVAEQRDRLEEERLREARRRFDREKEDALQAQKERCEQEKLAAVQSACDALRRQLRSEFDEEKQIFLARELALAEEQFLLREQETIRRITAECELRAADEAARVARQHREQMEAAEHRYSTLLRKHEEEEAAHVRTATDFRELQTDYQRFMNYTNGKYDSDYMMKLRQHGMSYARKSGTR